jgi:hypothetical protein
LKRYAITLRWRGYRWQLEGVARHSADLVIGLTQYFGPGLMITVKAI